MDHSSKEALGKVEMVTAIVKEEGGRMVGVEVEKEKCKGIVGLGIN